MSGSLPAFHVTHATAAKSIKNEDVLLVRPLLPSQPQSMMCMVCDGHSGAAAADHVTDQLHGLLLEALPSQQCPDVSLPGEFASFAEALRKCLCEAFVKMDNELTELGHLSGTTVTVLLVTGSLLTVANVGDSSAVLDTGCSILDLTRNHRIQDNLAESKRLLTAGCHLAQLGFHLRGPAMPGEAGVGPMRVWPGGLCVSRSIGDRDAGPEVMPLPHIRQVLVPAHGCRVIMASDGLWDVMSLSKAVRMARPRTAAAAATHLVKVAVSNLFGVVDDTSVIVVDMLPPGTACFPPPEVLALATSVPGGKGYGGLFACFRADVDEPDSRDVAGPGHLALLHDVDSFIAYPHLKGQILRRNLAAVVPESPVQVPEFTLHGSRMLASLQHGPSSDSHQPEGLLAHRGECAFGSAPMAASSVMEQHMGAADKLSGI